MTIKLIFVFVSKLNNFDIIIDDGPHSLESQLKFIDLYYPKTNLGGVVIIEDIHPDSLEPLKEKCRSNNLPFDYLSKLNLYNSTLLWIYK